MWWKSLASFARTGHRPDDAVPQAEKVQVGGSLGAPIHILGIGAEAPDYDLLGGLAGDLARTFEVSCHIEDDWLDPHFAFNPQRKQYYATAILERLVALRQQNGVGPHRLLGVAAVDLFVPVLTFVFGEAQLQGHCAVVSYHRLAETDRPDLLHPRLTKEAVHELGHTFGLRHCHEWSCVMSSSHAVERLDVKSAAFCRECARIVRQAKAGEP